MKLLLIITVFMCSSISLMGQSHFFGVQQNSLRNGNSNINNGQRTAINRSFDLNFIGGYSFKKTSLVGRIGYFVDKVEADKSDTINNIPGLAFTQHYTFNKNAFRLGIGLEKAYVFKEQVYVAVGFHIPFEFSPSHTQTINESFTDLGYPYRDAYAQIQYASSFLVKGLLSGRFHYFILPQWSLGVTFSAGISFERPQPLSVSSLQVYNELNELIQEERNERINNQYILSNVSAYGLGLQFHFR